jgi:beta-glucanase (GH16 family)
MENYLQYTKNEIICGSGYGGYGKNCVWHGHKHIPFKETADGWHYYSLEWSPEGYVYYFDGVEVNRETSPVSNVDQFILVSTECHGYRENGKHDPLLDQAILPDCFVVDHVRVFDPVNE